MRGLKVGILALGAMVLPIGTALAGEYPLTTQSIQLSSDTVDPGSEINFELDGYMPFGIVTVTLESDPITLGEFIADGAGHVIVDVSVPAAVSPGDHELKATGPSPDGGILVSSVPLSVTDPAAGTDAPDRSRMWLVLTVTALVAVVGIGAVAVQRVT